MLGSETESVQRRARQVILLLAKAKLLDEEAVQAVLSNALLNKQTVSKCRRSLLLTLAEEAFNPKSELLAVIDGIRGSEQSWPEDVCYLANKLWWTVQIRSNAKLPDLDELFKSAAKSKKYAAIAGCIVPALKNGVALPVASATGNDVTLQLLRLLIIPADQIDLISASATAQVMDSIKDHLARFPMLPVSSLARSLPGLMNGGHQECANRIWRALLAVERKDLIIALKTENWQWKNNLAPLLSIVAMNMGQSQSPSDDKSDLLLGRVACALVQSHVDLIHLICIFHEHDSLFSNHGLWRAAACRVNEKAVVFDALIETLLKSDNKQKVFGLAIKLIPGIKAGIARFAASHLQEATLLCSLLVEHGLTDEIKEVFCGMIPFALKHSNSKLMYSLYHGLGPRGPALVSAELFLRNRFNEINTDWIVTEESISKILGIDVMFEAMVPLIMAVFQSAAVKVEWIDQCLGLMQRETEKALPKELVEATVSMFSLRIGEMDEEGQEIWTWSSQVFDALARAEIDPGICASLLMDGRLHAMRLGAFLLAKSGRSFASIGEEERLQVLLLRELDIEGPAKLLLESVEQQAMGEVLLRKKILDYNLSDEHAQAAIAAMVRIAEPSMIFRMVPELYGQVLKWKIVRPANGATIVRERLAVLCEQVLRDAEAQTSAEEIAKFLIGQGLYDADESTRDTFYQASEHLLTKSDLRSLSQWMEGELGRAKKLGTVSGDIVCAYLVSLLVLLLPEESDGNNLLERLLEMLVIPSEMVQRATADSLVRFLSKNRKKRSQLALDLYEKTINAKSLAEKRGHAFGCAAVVRVNGAHLLQELGLLERIAASLLNDNEVKQAPIDRIVTGLSLLEAFSEMMGPRFQPYTLQPRLFLALTRSFADGRTEVRNATTGAVSSLMSHVSSPALCLLLPTILETYRAHGEGASSWRSRLACVEWLRCIAKKSPTASESRAGLKAAELSEIVALLMEAASDSHLAIQQAAQETLRALTGPDGTASVRCPEVRRLLPNTIVAALCAPHKETEACLKAILQSTFNHLVDEGALVFLLPVLRRALATGSSKEVRKRAAQLIANLALNLLEPAGLRRLVPSVVPVLKATLGDAVPEVRWNAAKALGVLARAMRPFSECAVMLATLRQELLQMVLSASSSCSLDRAGAALALAEVLAAHGQDHVLEELSNGLLSCSFKKENPFARESAVLLAGFLPCALQSLGLLSAEVFPELAKLLEESIALLGDDHEAVREAANRSCRVLTVRLARLDPMAVLSILGSALDASHCSWRIRLAGMDLVQRFLALFINEEERQKEKEEDDVIQEEEAKISAEELINEYGFDPQQLARLQARIFYGRFDDSNAALRQQALALWKSLVSHPVRALLSISTVLIQQLVPLLATVMKVHDREEESGIKANARIALSELLSKVGDRCCQSMLQELHSQLQGPNKAAVLLLATVIAQHYLSLSKKNLSASDDVWRPFLEEQLLSLVRKGLSDQDRETLHWATRLFALLLRRSASIGEGERLIAVIIDPILEELFADPANGSLMSLVALVNEDVERLLPHVVPRLFNQLRQQSPHLPAVKTAAQILATLLHGQSSAFHVSLALETIQVFVDSPLLHAALQVQEEQEGEAYHVLIQSCIQAIVSGADSDDLDLLCQLLQENCGMALILIEKILDVVPNAEHAHLLCYHLAEPMINILLPSPSTSTLARAIEFSFGVAPSEKVLSSLTAHFAKSSLSSSDYTAVIKALVRWFVSSQTTGTGIMPLGDILRLIKAMLLACDGSAWSSSMAACLGLLIRLATDKNSASYASLSLTLETIQAALKNHLALCRPFFPQLQRVLVQHLPSASSTVEESLSLLLPKIQRPEGLLGEWLALLTVEEGPIACSILRVLASISLETIPKLDHNLAEKCMDVCQLTIASPNARIRDAARSWAQSLAMITSLGDRPAKLLDMAANFS